MRSLRDWIWTSGCLLAVCVAVVLVAVASADDEETSSSFTTTTTTEEATTKGERVTGERRSLQMRASARTLWWRT